MESVLKHFRRKKTEFIDWKPYKKKIAFLSDFHFQQDARKHNIGRKWK